VCGILYTSYGKTCSDSKRSETSLGFNRGTVQLGTLNIARSFVVVLMASRGDIAA